VPLTAIWTLAAPWRTTKSPFRARLAVGVKVTATVQFASGARLVSQDDCSPKSFGSAPSMKKPKGLTKLAVAVPVLVTATVCGLLVEPTVTPPKLREDGERLKMMLPVPVAVPLDGSFCGLPAALSF
jgi:hypothetical protein